MLMNILSILFTIGLIALIVYVVSTAFPRLTKLWAALVIASLVVGVIGVLHKWICGWLCAP